MGEIKGQTAEAGTVMKHPTLAAALAAVQAVLPRVEKGKTGDAGSYKYQYADLADISPVVLPLLGLHGLAFTAQPTLIGERFVLKYALTHDGGEEQIEGMYPLPDPVATQPQKLGSAITYARRYTLCSVVGIAPGGDDDDANAASDAPAAARPQRQAPRQQKPAAPTPVATQDWGAEILPVRDLDALRSVYEAAEGAQEIGYTIGGDHKDSVLNLIHGWGLPTPTGAITVGQLIGAVKAKIEAGELPESEGAPVETTEPAAEGVTDSWAVVDIPKDGES